MKWDIMYLLKMEVIRLQCKFLVLYKIKQKKYILFSHEKALSYNMYLLASSRTFASISLLGGYLGKVEGSQASGFAVKNCKNNY